MKEKSFKIGVDFCHKSRPIVVGHRKKFKNFAEWSFKKNCHMFFFCEACERERKEAKNADINTHTTVLKIRHYPLLKPNKDIFVYTIEKPSRWVLCGPKEKKKTHCKKWRILHVQILGLPIRVDTSDDRWHSIAQ